MTKEFWKALLMRSIHAVWETAVSTLPATIVITPAMIEHFNASQAKVIACVVIAWALTALFSGVLSAAKSMKVGMPETALAETLYALDNEPFVEELDDEDDDEEYVFDDEEEGDK